MKALGREEGAQTIADWGQRKTPALDEEHRGRWRNEASTYGVALAVSPAGLFEPSCIVAKLMLL